MWVGRVEKVRRAVTLRRSSGRSKTHMTLFAIAQKPRTIRKSLSHLEIASCMIANAQNSRGEM